MQYNGNLFHPDIHVFSLARVLANIDMLYNMAA
jgi:hypothetical protein